MCTHPQVHHVSKLSGLGKKPACEVEGGMDKRIFVQIDHQGNTLGEQFRSADSHPTLSCPFFLI
jgi:hypothetical protein